MKLIVGLGNPGPKYETTRHNVGFLAVDRLIDEWKATGPLEKNQGEVWQAQVAGEKILLVKPQTFMNLSGRCVAPLAAFYKCEPQDLIVVHDDLDLESMVLRVKTGGGTGGHNGLKSIDECLGGANNGYHRMRIGIGHPARLGLRIGVADYVLQPLNDDECVELDRLLDKLVRAAELLVRGDARAAMTQYNRSDK